MIWIYCLVILLIVTALAIIDLRTMRLPNYLTVPLMVLGLLVSSFTDFGFCSASESLFGLLLGYFLIWAVNCVYFLFTKKHGIGMGDAKLLAAYGAILGFSNVLPILFISSVIGLIGGIIWLKLHKLNHQAAFPFGPFICVAGLIAISDVVFKTFFIRTFFGL
ncbi:prepilin peptidase [Polynucleobacter kasalickyi]|uniref:Leader peptidase (Prepilin peptidase) / N-methyltransferase n=1 Tax=Polynucleobacter kasalickyi TaxID=1938817 RepID=A0A1W2ACY9_9BURK|nr:A24 family peptidase [Polynucleobacter kasalickyi]SMC58547.1 leader peptidase (prepilin peptidase) / N-methyltransferase [Polynucleobacter kasalickyi]